MSKLVAPHGGKGLVGDQDRAVEIDQKQQLLHGIKGVLPLLLATAQGTLEHLSVVDILNNAIDKHHLTTGAAGAVGLDEAALLARVEERIRALDPDVITGWNVVDFDLKVLDRRAKELSVPILASVFAAPSAVQAFAAAAGETARGLPAAVIGPTTEAAARESGLQVLATASPSMATASSGAATVV